MLLLEGQIAIMEKKQSKADKAFIAKIGTIGISTGGKTPSSGDDVEQIGELHGEIHGKKMSGPVYAPRQRQQRPSAAPTANEQSFSA